MICTAFIRTYIHTYIHTYIQPQHMYVVVPVVVLQSILTRYTCKYMHTRTHCFCTYHIGNSTYINVSTYKHFWCSLYYNSLVKNSSILNPKNFYSMPIRYPPGYSKCLYINCSLHQDTPQGWTCWTQYALQTHPILRGNVYKRGYPTLQETPIETESLLILIGRILNINGSSKAVGMVTNKF